MLSFTQLLNAEGVLFGAKRRRFLFGVKRRRFLFGAERRRFLFGAERRRRSQISAQGFYPGIQDKRGPTNAESVGKPICVSPTLSELSHLLVVWTQG